MGKVSKNKAKQRPKKSPTSSAARAGSAGQGSRRALLAMLLALLIGFVLAGWGSWLWRKVEPTLRDSDQYRLEPAQIEIRPDPPEWIRRDVRAEVLRGVAFGQPLSMLDENLPARIAEAFEFHPWVERATVVLRYPARAEVELVYRRPVARLMVENHAGEDQFVLDSTGVRLPETDLTAKEVASLPGIMGMSGIHLPVVGQRMEDERTREAVEVAAVLLDDWSSLRLVGIVPLAALQGETGERRQVFELQEAGGTRIIWGAAPSKAVVEEPSVEKKLQRLQRLARTIAEGQTKPPNSIDLRAGINDAR